MQIIEVYPEMGPFLMEYGMSCVGCFVSYDENLWQAAQGHGMDVFEIIGEMNEFIADKYKKPLLTEDTPMSSHYVSAAPDRFPEPEHPDAFRHEDIDRHHVPRCRR